MAETIEPLQTPSAEQQTIFEAALTSDENMVINALAGTGKTTALVQLVRIFATRNLSVCCLSFGKKDKARLEQCCGKQAAVYTSHGAGLACLSAWARSKRVKVNEGIDHKILFQQFKGDGLIDKDGKWKVSYNVFAAVLALVDKARTVLPLQTPQKPTDKDYSDLAERFDIDIKQENLAAVLFYCHWLFAEMANLQKVLVNGTDYTNMVFLPVYHNLKPLKTFDRVLVDEGQDQNFMNRELALLYTK
jgi:superfamily I DNA/RNA helicase